MCRPVAPERALAAMAADSDARAIVGSDGTRASRKHAPAATKAKGANRDADLTIDTGASGKWGRKNMAPDGKVGNQRPSG